MATREEMKVEAVRRLKELNVTAGVLEKFNNGLLLVSERQDAVFDGILYDTEGYKGLDEKIKEYEQSSGNLVYHVQLSYTEFGEMYSLLAVSPYEEEWEYELDGEFCFAYVWNKTEPMFSEAGTIGVVGKNGGVSRTF